MLQRSISYPVKIVLSSRSPLIMLLRCNYGIPHVEVSLSPQDGHTPLTMAIWEGHEEVVRLLLQSGSHQQPDQVRDTISTTSECMHYLRANAAAWKCACA